MLRTRVITAVILVVCFLSALFLAPAVWWSLLTLGAVLAAASEFGRLWGLAPAEEFGYLIGTAGIGCLVEFVFPPHAVSVPAYWLAATFWLLVAPPWLFNAWKPRAKWLAALTGWVILFPAWLALIELRALGPLWLLAIMALVWVADIAAYFTGRALGRHKLAPSISPGKTWEGAAGGLIAVLVYAALAIWAWQSASGSAAETAGLADREPMDPMHWFWLLAFALALGGMSILGDLYESAVKRGAGVKDSGTLLPGHGGILDRADALLPVLPLAALIFGWR
jgi:phosphatidate cytidylyltransferase